VKTPTRKKPVEKKQFVLFFYFTAAKNSLSLLPVSPSTQSNEEEDIPSKSLILAAENKKAEKDRTKPRRKGPSRQNQRNLTAQLRKGLK
jgi:hypothetical protein